MKRTAVFLLGLLAIGCAPSPTVGPLDVRILYSVGGKGDGSIADDVFAGLVFARAATTFEIEEAEPTSAAEATSILERWLSLRKNRQLVVVGSGAFSEAVSDRECDFGTALVLQLDAPLPTCADLRSVTYRTFGPAFLAGVSAASDPTINPGRTVGIVGGADIPPVRELIDGFAAGVAFAGGTVVRTEFVSMDPDTGFSDKPAARALAESMFGEVGVIFAAAGESGDGVAEALDERWDAVPDARIHYVGSDVDHSARWGRITLGSVLKRFSSTVRDAIFEAVVGTYSSGDVRVGFADGLTEYVHHPLKANTVVAGDCAGCEPFDRPCYAACTTLQDVVDQAADDAARAAQAYEASP